MASWSDATERSTTSTSWELANSHEVTPAAGKGIKRLHISMQVKGDYATAQTAARMTGQEEGGAEVDIEVGYKIGTSYATVEEGADQEYAVNKKVMFRWYWSKSNPTGTTRWERNLYVEWEEYAGGVSHTKTITEILGLVDSYTRVATHKKEVSELLGLVDSYDKNRCKKCKPSVIVIF